MMGILYGESINAASPKLERLTDDAEILRQALECAMQTPRGSYWWAPEEGIDLREFVLAGLTAERLATIPAEVEGVLRMDERFARANVTSAVQITSGGGAALRLEIAVTPQGAAGLPFRYTAEATADLVRLYTRGI